jgi:hypothetical protein
VYDELGAMAQQRSYGILARRFSLVAVLFSFQSLCDKANSFDVRKTSNVAVLSSFQSLCDSKGKSYRA